MKRALLFISLAFVLSFNSASAIPPIEVRLLPQTINYDEMDDPCCYPRAMPFYTKGWCGASFLHDDIHDMTLKYERGISAGLALGAPVWQCGWLLFEFEAEGIYLHNKIKDLVVQGIETGIKGNIWDYAILGNFIFSIPFKCGLKPYGGAGIGYGWEYSEIHAPLLKVRNKERRFVYQYVGGFSYTFINNLCATVSIFAEGRYFRFDKHVYAAIADAGLIIEF